MLHSMIEQKAIDMYRKIRIFSFHDFDIETIAHRLEISLHFKDKKTTTIFLPNHICVIIYKYMPKYHQIWAFFHEVGHPILHDTDQKSAVKPVSDFMEVQANRFALHASMPIHLVREMDYITPYTLAHIFNVPLWAAERRMLQLESKMHERRMIYG
ncbi:ImmA/IrrE family metallo-endopeptidase [Natribacillus halophilus]|uniref:Zn-dependent peptidase ImmA, M78 family n=1 Tax=Natribacillus halophilus TaxID=549003 RepID=A0A1G8RWX9_9BACI|nr:ImmA/IrrE family metallo-endopeptidase [Natribacillus halophilus]SDJ20920.1 Zn-dependent peptidase ImmA, M78 family [Natribacillus halophilus]